MTNLGTVTVINLSGGPNGNISGGQIGLIKGSDNFRVDIRNAAFCIDQAISPLGFAGVESLDLGVTGGWVNKFQI